MEKFSFTSPRGIHQGYMRVDHDPCTPPFIVKSGIGWHYTSISSAEKIIDSQFLYSTSYKNLNDHQELLYGVKKLEKIWKSKEIQSIYGSSVRAVLDDLDFNLLIDDGMENLFSLSVSKSKDDNFQWALYGDDCYGVSFGIDLRSEFRPFPDESKFGRDYSAFASSWLRVIYSEKNQERAIKIFIEKIINKFTNQDKYLGGADYKLLNLLMATTLKDPRFRSEKELRAVFYTRDINPSIKIDSPHEKYFIPWSGYYTDNGGIPHKSVLPIKYIQFGPRANPKDKDLITSKILNKGLDIQII